MRKYFTRLFGSKSITKGRKIKPQRVRLSVESLEDRVLAHAGPLGDAEIFSDYHAVAAGGQDQFAPDPQGDNDGDGEPNGNPGNDPPLPVPAHSSKPGAPATVYLDFNGHYQQCRGKRVWSATQGYHCGGTATPAKDITTRTFNLNGSDSHSFDSTELAMIKEIWQRVAEDFAPFNINVTTVEPSGGIDNGEELRVAIGGFNTDWCGSGCGSGISNGGSFTNDYANIVYVFSAYIGGNAAMIATTASHEAGHSFGLDHQSRYISDGSGGFMLDQEYSTGTPDRTPIMGNNLSTDRTTWHTGTKYVGEHTDTLSYQDDMKIIDERNGFGYRVDDHANTYSGATPLRMVGSSLGGSGIIEKTTDKDVFVFNTYGGQMSLQFNVAAVGANLDAKLSLFKEVVKKGRPSYTLVASTDPAAATGTTWNVNLAAGKYFVVVASQGNYGDVGQYTIGGTAPAGPILGSITVPPVVVNPPPVVTPPPPSLPKPPGRRRSIAAGAARASFDEASTQHVSELMTHAGSRRLHGATLDRLLDQKDADEFLGDILSAAWEVSDKS